MAVASDGTFGAYVEVTLAGGGAVDGAQRRYRVRGVNASGDGPASAEAVGYRSSAPTMLQWQRSAGTVDADYSDLPGATTATWQDGDAPSDGTIRWYRCVVTDGRSMAVSAADSGHRNQEICGDTELEPSRRPRAL